MSRRKELEHEVSLAQERIKKAPKDTPREILKIWEQELLIWKWNLIIWSTTRKIITIESLFCIIKGPYKNCTGFFKGNRILPVTFGNGYA